MTIIESRISKTIIIVSFFCNSFFSKAQNNSNILVWYYADWCGHCQMMKDEWEKLVNSKPTVNLAKVSDNFVSPYANDKEATAANG